MAQFRRARRQLHRGSRRSAPRRHRVSAAGPTWWPLGSPRRRRDVADGFRYANLAVRGRLFDASSTEQVPAALRMKPDLVSFAGGGNDVLRRNFDPAAMLARFDEVIATFAPPAPT